MKLQMDDFRALGGRISNCRRIQPLNNRQIYEFLISETAAGSAEMLDSSYLGIMIISLITFIGILDRIN